MMPAVSVIIPAFNSEAYVGQTVESALAQTHMNREIIVVDDGSTDGTAALLKRFGERIRLIQQSNGGVAAACNAGVRAARGEWIAFLDADDQWLPAKLQAQLENCASFPISHTDSVCFGDHIAEVRRSSFEPPHSGQVLSQLLVRNFITKSTVLMRRDLYLDCGGFDEAYAGVEDWPFFLKVCARVPLGYAPDANVRYRVHLKSKSMNARKMMRDHLRIIDEAFSSEGVGKDHPELRRAALLSSYQVNNHYAAECGDWTFAVRCAVQALRLAPADPGNWKNLVRSALIAVGRRY